MIKRALFGGAVATVIMAGGSALAADPPMAPWPAELPPAPMMYDPWTGFYVGAHVGYGWGDHDFSAGPADAATTTFWEWSNGLLFSTGATFDPVGVPTALSVDSKGILGGFQGGYNHRWGSLLLGVEADISWAGIDGRTDFVVGAPAQLTPDPPQLTFGASAHVDWLATLRGRIGLLATEDLLIYGTGGLAFGKVRYSYGFSSQHPLNPAYDNAGIYGSTSKTKTGWTLGAGLEWALDENWTVKAEYLYYDLGGTTFSTAGFGGAVNAGNFNVRADTKLHTARIGINYRFGHRSSQPVIAKY